MTTRPQKIIGIDLDDVLFNFCEAFVQYHNATHDTNYTRDQITYFSIDKSFGLPSEVALERIHGFFQSPEHKDGPPVEGAIEAVARLAEHHELHIITAKPAELREQVEAWIGKHFPQKFKKVHFTRDRWHDGTSIKKHVVCQELGVELFIDDALENAEGIAECGIPVLLFDTPWNQGELPPLVTRVRSWEEIVNIVNST